MENASESGCGAATGGGTHSPAIPISVSVASLPPSCMMRSVPSRVPAAVGVKTIPMDRAVPGSNVKDATSKRNSGEPEVTAETVRSVVPPFPTSSAAEVDPPRKTEPKERRCVSTTRTGAPPTASVAGSS